MKKFSLKWTKCFITSGIVFLYMSSPQVLQRACKPRQKIAICTFYFCQTPEKNECTLFLYKVSLIEQAESEALHPKHFFHQVIWPWGENFCTSLKCCEGAHNCMRALPYSHHENVRLQSITQAMQHPNHPCIRAGCKLVSNWNQKCILQLTFWIIFSFCVVDYVV